MLSQAFASLEYSPFKLPWSQAPKGSPALVKEKLSIAHPESLEVELTGVHMTKRKATAVLLDRFGRPSRGKVSCDQP